MKHIPIIHSLRGIAALAVCLHHFVSTTIGLFEKEIQNGFEFGKYGVQMFFVISGIVIPLSMIKSGYNFNHFYKFLKKRIIRIEPTYLASILVALVYVHVRNIIPGTTAIDLTPSLTNIILHIGYIIPFFENQPWLNPVYWTLAIEFQYYLIISLTLPLLLNSNKFIQYSIILVFALLGFILPQSSMIFSWLPCFMFGICYILYKSNKLKLGELILILLFNTLVLYLLKGQISALVALFTLFIIIIIPNTKNKVTHFLGDISYSLYLIHSIIGAAFINFMSHKVYSTVGKITIVAIGLIISLISAYIMYLLVEKPSHDYAKRLLIRNENNTTLSTSSKKLKK